MNEYQSQIAVASRKNMPNINLICAYNICAAHQLKRHDWTDEQNTKVFGKCANIHGHYYKMELCLSGEVSNETGMLINGFDVDKIVTPFIEKNFDHKFLNQDVAFFKDCQPTAEMIAYWVYRELKDQFPKHVQLDKVRIYETPELIVEYAADNREVQMERSDIIRHQC